jgi:S-adenosylmethionine:tRNA ribosyltransferase-isomerase
VALVDKARRQKVGRAYEFPGGLKGVIVSEKADEKVVQFEEPIGDEYLDKAGHIPLPPYIKRDDESSDSERYQTVYAKSTGSAACPTAGLHFTRPILDSITAAGIDIEWVTLHVGLGTFLPVRVEQIEQHKMHEEWYTVPERTAEAVNAARREGRKVLAVGTTSLRTLESAWDDEACSLKADASKTSIFIYPGYRFKAIDQLFTNFHTPKSTLLMLVSAFAGKELILDAYAEAVRERYRFFSYGDAMLIR